MEEIRKNSEQMDIDTAVDHAIDSMPEEYVIRPFLAGNRAEVRDMCITEYNEAETMQMTAEQAMSALRIPEARFGQYREKLTGR